MKKLSNQPPLTTVATTKSSSNFALLTHTAICGIFMLPASLQAEETKAKQLPTVTVIESQANNKYNSPESSYYKLNGPLLDTPRTVTTVTRQLMNDQGITKVSDALRNVPGISLAAGEGGNQGDNLMIRGFSARNDFFVDGMRDFGNYYRDAFNLESIEVVQGPSSILFGRGSSGGVVHQNSKQAFLGSKTDGSIMLGTNDLARATVDVNRQIEGIKGSAVRINAMANTNKVAERDYAQYRRAGFAPSLAFGIGTDTRFNISHLYQAEDNVPDYGIPFYKTTPVDTDRSNFYGFKNDYLKTDVNITTAKFEHDFDKDLTFRNQTRYARYTRDVRVTEPQLTTNPNSVTRSMKIRESLETYLGNQADLTGKFSTFGIKHEGTVGLAVESESSAPTVYGYGNTTTDTQNPTQVPFNNSAVTFTSASKAKVDTLGVYVLDTVKFDEKWIASVGARFDNLKTSFDTLASNVRTTASRTDNVLSYSAGLTYKPAHNGSIYFNHGTSFNPSAESLTLTATSTTGTNNFNTKPEKNVIYELGTKWDLLKKRLSTTFAIYRAEKYNARENNPFGSTNNQVNSGQQRVYGLLAQVSGKLTDNWNIMTGYSYMDGEIAKSVVAAQKNRPLANVPEHTFSLFTTYQMNQDLMIGGGANFISTRYAGSSATGAGVDTVTGGYRRAPSYFLFNAVAKYQATKNIGLQLNILNLTNEYYFDQIRGNNAVVPGDGRTFMLTTNVSF